MSKSDIRLCRDYKVPKGKVAATENIKKGIFHILLKKQVPEDWKIILCFCCDRPATIIDHHWPWLTEHCRCDEHALDKQSSSVRIQRIA